MKASGNPQYILSIPSIGRANLHFVTKNNEMIVKGKIDLNIIFLFAVIFIYVVFIPTEILKSLFYSAPCLCSININSPFSFAS